ncbi:ABC transporter ATP-binding protein [Ignisphaera sp. 4213-co]|uniref:ABC transporter ATP-binding protein n=1 Tax=Ignisphaera cupida TaxID=3050454 RepID=A0ABD4Z7I1_9CREN|nr:ABC transporter ATP-binding protein [Ignisphaera sp. 4213-co]MDK6028830.1 ABC transporter ATP-binding protein [Ignisphaera sp. 4213-co]
MSEDSKLRIENVTKLYGYGLLGLKKFKALDNISMDIDLTKPRIVVLAGETGSGKTTLLRIIMGMVKPNIGRVFYKGRDIHKLRGSEAKWYRREVQPIFQDPYETFNPLRKIDSYFYDTIRNVVGIKNRGEAEHRIDESLRFVGLSLDRVKGKYPHEFSGGELQRISIARALLTHPKMLLADEPVSMLDATLRVGILNILKNLKEKLNMVIIYVTHDLSTAYYIGDDISIMYRGTLVEYGPISKVYQEPRHPYTYALLESILEPDPSIRERYPAIKPSSIELKEFLIPGCRYANRCPYAKEICWHTLPPPTNVDGVVVRCWKYLDYKQS